MPRKYLASYKRQALKSGCKDPFLYIWERYEVARKAEKHREAMRLAELLLPYGHGKRAPVDDKGEVVTDRLIIKNLTK